MSEVGRQGKSGYYLTINFEKFGGADRPALRIIRFGWLDHNDWIAQTAATGQQSRVRPEAYSYKLRTLYSKSPGVPEVPRFETVEPKYSFADPFAVGDDARAGGPVDVIDELR